MTTDQAPLQVAVRRLEEAAAELEENEVKLGRRNGVERRKELQ
jgi:hypothetical protein